MPGICFYFEDNDRDVYSGRRIDLDAWNYAIKAAGDITKMVVVNRTDQELTTPDGNLDFQVVSESPDFGDERVAYVVCPWDVCADKQELWNFDHAVDWYVFGPAGGWATTTADKCGVYIPQHGIAACHSVHIATAVMLHRHKVVRWQSP